MIVTTDLGLRYQVEELGRGQFQVRMLNPEDRPALNPWRNTPNLPICNVAVIPSLTLKLGEPLAFRNLSGEQIPVSELRERGYADHNRIVSIAA